MWAQIKRVRNISLKWKLLIPFIFLPVALTVLLVAWGIRSQNQILLEQETQRMEQIYQTFQQRLHRQLEMSVALAEVVGSNPLVQEALARRDRDRLIELYMPVFQRLKNLVGIKQFHFHTYPPRSFLRLHKPEQHGDDLLYRQTILEAHETGSVIGGLEFGATGFGLRGVAPVYYQGRTVGSVEVGSSIEQPFLDRLKTDLACDFTIYLPDADAPAGIRILASTCPGRTYLAPTTYKAILRNGGHRFLTTDAKASGLAVVIGPIQNFQGRRVGVIELSRDRQKTIFLIRKYRTLILSFGLASMLLALIFVWLVSTLFLAPIKALVDQAERISTGKRVPKMEVKVRDEFGVLAEALNRMLAALEDSRYRLLNYAQLLETRVEERTAELVKSEEKFRTLVEHIPLVVYRLEPGLVRTFVSSYIENLTGWPADNLVGGPAVWAPMIHPEDRDRVIEAKNRALGNSTSFEMEYRLQDRQGLAVDILDHAEPIRDEQGRILYLEGYMLDIRESRRLREQTLQAEELKSLSEISARLAHEFRNPLSVVGLCARRLEKSLSETDPSSPYAKILGEQVARLEQILKMIQTYLKAYILPMELHLAESDLGEFLDRVVREVEPYLNENQVRLNLNISNNGHRLRIDPEGLSRALIDLIRNAAYQMPPRGVLNISAVKAGAMVEIRLVYPAGYLSDDQLRHFFYPFTTEDEDASLIDLPLVPVMVHRHNGIINVGREGDDLIAVLIDLPLA